jgi:transposase
LESNGARDAVGSDQVVFPIKKGVNKYDLNKYCRVLAKEYVFADKLNSTARQSSAERAWSGIARFFDNCKKQVKGKKGFPKFKKNSILLAERVRTIDLRRAKERGAIAIMAKPFDSVNLAQQIAEVLSWFAPE